MAVFYFFSVLLAFIYIFIITHFYTAWNEITEWECDDSFKPNTFVSILIPFRNEENDIQACVESVLKSQFPKSSYEIIAIDDHSEDHGAEIVAGINSTNLTMIHLRDYEVQTKKEAIKVGVDKAKGKLVITLDGDCVVPRKWLRNIVSYYEYTGKSIIAGLVRVSGNKNSLEYFQVMDTCGTMGMHAAGIHNKTHYLSNGANLIFEKSLFEEIKPYESNSEFASGDDVFFINKVAEKDPSLIGVLKSIETTVETFAEKEWKSFWDQRKRWAGKSAAFSKGIYKWMTGSIWLFSLSILLNIILIPFTSSFSLFVLLMQLLIKGIMDYLYLMNMCKYFERSKSLKRFFPGLMIHILYVAIAGVYALVGSKYQWKGRDLR